MATHRSLNKLEFKAHMSIHNMTEVGEGEQHESRNGTRDRFGKTHPLSDQDGSSRVRRRPVRPAAIVFLLLVLCFPAHADGPSSTSSTIPSTARNTDIRIESEGLDENALLNRNLGQEREETPDFGIALDDSTSIGFNDDGDPQIGTRF